MMRQCPQYQERWACPVPRTEGLRGAGERAWRGPCGPAGGPGSFSWARWSWWSVPRWSAARQHPGSSSRGPRSSSPACLGCCRCRQL